MDFKPLLALIVVPSTFIIVSSMSMDLSLMLSNFKLSTEEGIPMLSAILAILITYALMKPRCKDNNPESEAELKATVKGTRYPAAWPTPAQVLGLIQQRRSIFPKVGSKDTKHFSLIR